MELLVTAVLALHLLCMNLATAGPLLCVELEWREWRGDVAAGRLGRSLLGWTVVALLPGILLGVLAGWLAWDTGLREAVGRVPSKVYYGAWEILFSFVLMLGHWIWWRRGTGSGAGQRTLRTLFALLASTNLMYHFPVLFAVLTELVHRGDLNGPALTSAEFRHELVSGSVMARAIHAAIASFAVAGLFASWQGLTLFVADEAAAQRWSGWGARWALLATLAQVPIGLWVLSQLSPIAQHRVMGGDVIASICLGSALLTALWLAHLLAAIALREGSRTKVLQAVLAMILVVGLMEGASRRIMKPVNTLGNSGAGVSLDARIASRSVNSIVDQTGSDRAIAF